MDRGHYSSWGQVPLTIKGPASDLERMEVERGEKTEKETVAAERVNINTAGERRRWRGREEGGGTAGRGDSARTVFSL